MCARSTVLWVFLMGFAMLAGLPSSASAQTANIGNFVWRDLNRNGIQDAGEPGIADVTVQLWNGARTQLLASTTTNANGIYTLQGPTGTAIRVRAILPDASLRFSPMDAGGDDTRDSDIFPSGSEAGFTASFTLASNVISITSFDVGMMTPPMANVGNFVWRDLNRNGVQDSGEPGIPDVTVQLWNGARTQLLASTTTNANGIYTLQGENGIALRVRALLPDASLRFSPMDAGGDDTRDSDIFPSGSEAGFTASFTLASNVISNTSFDIGMMTPAMANLGNRVWEDFDGDGVQGAGEPGLAGVTMQLWNSAMTQLLDSTTTDANGIYTLITPEPGDYRLRALLPVGFTRSPKDQGGDDTRDSDFNTGVPIGFTDIYTIAPNLISITSIDAGMRGSTLFRSGFEDL
ncbi:SdrD B-like domain-containing protein [Aquimonas voraii]|uniref:Cna protein B-type domain-containing protein n=1 Tax=Aquimonas voraii TaxID=265719 RepID=A0A1G6YLQ7_9GAMM|nr:SdrD B-like domain-containing protein [Aquimonas voraii]SDD91444.1 Cna protein B-type domain-containing protein [Aquimonas voraii]